MVASTHTGGGGGGGGGGGLLNPNETKSLVYTSTMKSSILDWQD